MLDFLFKIKKQIIPFILSFYWKLYLKELGRGSYIYKGLIIIGNPRRIRVGKNFKIWHRCTLSVVNGSIEFGNNGLLGVNSYINASQGSVKIGNNVAIAPFCQIYSYSHHYSENLLITESFKVGDVTIEDDVLIGSNVVVLPGITISKGAIVAAGSIVNKSVPEYTIVGGNPIKEIGKRKRYEGINHSEL